MSRNRIIEVYIPMLCFPTLSYRFFFLFDQNAYNIHLMSVYLFHMRPQSGDVAYSLYREVDFKFGINRLCSLYRSSVLYSLPQLSPC